LDIVILGITKDRVITVLTIDSIPTRPTPNRVFIGASKKGILTRATLDQIITSSSLNDVTLLAAAKGIRSCSTVEPISAWSSIERIVTSSAIKTIHSGRADKRIVTGPTVYRIVSSATLNLIISSTGIDGVVIISTIDIVDLIPCGNAIVTTLAVKRSRANRSQDITTVASIERVASRATRNRVVAIVSKRRNRYPNSLCREGIIRCTTIKFDSGHLCRLESSDRSIGTARNDVISHPEQPGAGVHKRDRSR
jgi:hypothetical protein